MIYYNLKLVIFSIILGTLTLIYNNDFNSLYKNINYENIVLGPINYRSLAEYSHEHRTNHKHKNRELREYQKTKEEQYKKNKYPNDGAKTKQKIRQVTENENTGISNLRKYKKESYDNAQGGNSNKSPRSLKYSEIQRKLYNDLDGKQDRDVQNYSDDEYDSKIEKYVHKCFLVILLILSFPHALVLPCTYCKKKMHTD
ncbi:stevor PIR protein, putative [Plasmodium sp. gorilla clade G2]|uniref:stevor PIR protein, putative n=1 Tax=Plasmodium sp. gorilla clade G2 TaxID=880535 RepID=UPI000D2A2F15|nr:stevor PIR protein, putative [Plasmodium sp. gorilla clade G2]SOV20228.1 stevor PIR protein, putative [Plasmodium sp. gorilla clade G2]